VACGFVYYFNPTVAAGAIVRDAAGRVLLLRRAQEPARGKLAIPGGFIDFGERAEEGLRREIKEEVNLEVGELHFLGSEINHYVYREVVYPVVDLFFLTTVVSTDGLAALDGVETVAWYRPEAIAWEEIAFPSVRRALERALR
jgi:ADP-ribose pyrophosphatase YjhB (NUDIX family)